MFLPSLFHSEVTGIVLGTLLWVSLLKQGVGPADLQRFLPTLKVFVKVDRNLLQEKEKLYFELSLL